MPFFHIRLDLYHDSSIDMVAALGETTAGPTISWLRDQMLASPEGRKILKERPRVNSTTVDMDALARLPDGSLGKAYVTWLERCGVTPDTREPVRVVMFSFVQFFCFTILV